MFKIAQAVDLRSRAEARDVIDRIYKERPDYWPHGIDMNGFDGGLYLVREKGTSKAAGFCGWQERWEMEGDRQVKTGYYSIGILPEFRRNGFAKQAVSKIINMKAAGVDRVRAYIMPHNKPSLELAKVLDVPVVKKADFDWTRWRQRDRSWTPELLAGGTAAALPGTSLAQYYMQDLPAMRRMYKDTPVISWSTMRRKMRPGDVMFETPLDVADQSTVGKLSRDFQGVFPQHAAAVGPRGRIYHGGGTHGFGDAFGRITEPFVEGKAKLQDLARPSMWRRLWNAARVGGPAYREHMRKLRYPAYVRSLGQTPHDAFGSTRGDLIFATRSQEFEKLAPARQKQMVKFMETMNARPYSVTGAFKTGLLNLLVPRQARLGGHIPHPGLPHTSFCGGLPAQFLKRLGQWKGNPATTTPLDLMTSGLLKPYGLAVVGQSDPNKIRAAGLAALEAASKRRIALGGLGMLGLGAAAGGLASLRRLREQ